MAPSFHHAILALLTRFLGMCSVLGVSKKVDASLGLGAAVAPKAIDFRQNLPKTRSGKIMRRLLKARELGLPEGDLSTLESDEKK